MAIAGLSQSGMMVIQAEAPGASEVIPPSTSLRKIMKKRGKVKNYSRKQFLLKKKAVMDKMLNVDTRIEDLSNLLSGMDRQKKYVGVGVKFRLIDMQENKSDISLQRFQSCNLIVILEVHENSNEKQLPC